MTEISKITQKREPTSCGPGCTKMLNWEIYLVFKGERMNESKKTVLTRLNINIDKNLKDEFLKLCKENDSDATKVIRQFVKSYIKKHKKI